ncbi:unnamed protein product [Hermetia illucens]|uniref:Tudor domain-containing protein n=1 Tax=Hermetia illucens TaxID=343691 RepID=A0A7R8YWC1_HERIL|nr:uncharacterized protein LOC119655785 [Hermetia illucens]CAD7088253.1 unnamed protein product [Hermetia illucens]
MVDCEDPDLIKITHYINPHMFWYKYEDSFFRNTELSKWEGRLSALLSNKPPLPTSCYRAQINEIVAVYNFSFNRWIRAKCDEIVQFTIANTKYVVWAIDYGIPFQTEGRWIKRFPKDVGEPPEDSVFFGGINNIIPAEKEFNFETCKSEIHPTSKWSPLAVRTIENLIYEAAHIRFVRHIISKEGQYFGNLEFITHTNQIIKADASLLEINHAVHTEEFLRVMRQIGTNQISRWQNNEGASFVSKFNVNKLSNVARFEPKEMLIRNQMQNDGESLYKEEVTRKITDWALRNQICQGQGEDSTVGDDTASVCESSVSVALTRKIATEKLPIEKDDGFVDDNPVMLKGGVYRKKHLERYKESIPPPPSENRKQGYTTLQEESGSEFGDSETIPRTNGKSTQAPLVVQPKSTCHDKDDSSTSNETEVNRKAKDMDEIDCDKSVISGQSNAPTHSAIRVVMDRMHNRRKSLQEKLAAQQKIPPSAIPAGFDLRNLQNSRAIKNDAPSSNFNRSGMNKNNRFKKGTNYAVSTRNDRNDNGFRKGNYAKVIDERW